MRCYQFGSLNSTHTTSGVAGGQSLSSWKRVSRSGEMNIPGAGANTGAMFPSRAGDSRRSRCDEDLFAGATAGTHASASEQMLKRNGVGDCISLEVCSVPGIKSALLRLMSWRPVTIRCCSGGREFDKLVSVRPTRFRPFRSNGSQ